MDSLKWIPLIKKMIKKYNCYLTGTYNKVLNLDCVLCIQAAKEQRRARCSNGPRSCYTCDYCIHVIITGVMCINQPTFKKLKKNRWISINGLGTHSNPLALFERRFKKITPKDKNMIQARIEFLKQMLEKIQKESTEGERR